MEVLIQPTTIISKRFFFLMTPSGNYSLVIEIVAKDGTAYTASYHHFQVGDEKSNFKLRISG